jgi:hypothetical protein
MRALHLFLGISIPASFIVAACSSSVPKAKPPQKSTKEGASTDADKSADGDGTDNGTDSVSTQPKASPSPVTPSSPVVTPANPAPSVTATPAPQPTNQQALPASGAPDGIGQIPVIPPGVTGSTVAQCNSQGKVWIPSVVGSQFNGACGEALAKFVCTTENLAQYYTAYGQGASYNNFTATYPGFVLYNCGYTDAGQLQTHWVKVTNGLMTYASQRIGWTPPATP